MRNPGGPIPDALRWACVPRWFTEDIFTSTLIQDGASCRGTDAFQDVTSSDYCRPYDAVHGAYEIIPEIRRVVNAQSEANRREHWHRLHDALNDYHEARSASSGPSAFLHRVEMVYHSLFVDEGTGMDLLDALFLDNLEVNDLARCQAFVEAGRDWAAECLPQEGSAWRLRLCEAELRWAQHRWQEAYDLALSLAKLDLQSSVKISLRIRKVLCGAGIRCKAEEGIVRMLKQELRGPPACAPGYRAGLLRLMSDACMSDLQWKEAMACLDDAAMVLRPEMKKYARDLCEVLMAAARYALAGEDGTGAWNHLREASSVAAQWGSIPLRVDVELAHARFFRARHDWQGALWRCREALRMAESSKEDILAARVLMECAQIARDEETWKTRKAGVRSLEQSTPDNAYAPAIGYCREALSICRDLQRTDLEGRARAELAALLWEQGKRTEAVQEMGRALEQFNALGALAEVAAATELLNRWLIETGGDGALRNNPAEGQG